MNAHADVGRGPSGDRPAGVAVLARLLALLRDRPRHVALAALLGGLVLGPRSTVAVVLLGAAGVTAAGGPGSATIVVLAAAGGAVAGSARLHAYDAFSARGWIGHAIRGRAELTGPSQRLPWGGWQAPARLAGRWDGARVQLRVRAGTPAPAAGTGAVVGVVGGLRALKPRESFLRSRGIGAVLDADALRWEPERRVRGGLLGAVDAIRRRAQRALRSGVPAAEGSLLVGMVLGDASGLDDQDADDLRTAGLTHLVAASGANVALLVAFAFAVGAVAGASIPWRLGGALLAIAVYVPLAGAGPSVQRAGVMGAATLVAVMAGRPGTRWYALLLAAVVTTLINPRAIEDAGWQLSFVAVAAILLGAAPLGRALRERRVPGPAADLLGVTVAATLATAPLIAWHFERASLVSLPANVLVAPAVAPAMWLGFGAAVVGQVSAALAAPLAWLAAVPVAFVLWVGRAAAKVPDATVAASPAVVAGIVLTVALVLVSVLGRSGASHRARRIRAGAAVLAVTGVGGAVLVPVLLFSSTTRPPAGFQVAFLDIGQGDATLLRHGNHAVLVDSGPPDGALLERLDALGVRALDVLVMTHAQADHDGGAAGVLGAMPVGLLLDGRDGVRDGPGARAATVAAQRGVRRIAGVAGMVVRAGPIALHVLSPPAADPESHGGTDPNDRAIVALARDGRTTVLLTADAESPVLAGLELPRIDILKVSHHGSADDGLPALLMRLQPRIAGIEVGAHNTYGHPAPGTVAALRRAVPLVVRTDRDGTVTVSPSGRGLAVSRGT